jgi:hypothetical protein
MLAALQIVPAVLFLSLGRYRPELNGKTVTGAAAAA